MSLEKNFAVSSSLGAGYFDALKAHLNVEDLSLLKEQINMVKETLAVEAMQILASNLYELTKTQHHNLPDDDLDNMRKDIRHLNDLIEITSTQKGYARFVPDFLSQDL